MPADGATAGSPQRVVRRYVVTEIYDRKTNPRTQTTRRAMEEWEAVVLDVFSEWIEPETRVAMLKAAGEIRIERLCAFIGEQLPEANVDGCRREMLEHLRERLGRVEVTPNGEAEQRGKNL